MSRTIKTKVVGVTFDNEFGENRQDVIQKCYEGESLDLKHYYFKGEDAVLVQALDGDIGNLNSKMAADLVNEFGISEIEMAEVEILEITGGSGKNYGVNIEIRIGEDEFEIPEPVPVRAIVKKEERNNKGKLKSAKLYGILFQVLGVICFLLGLVCLLISIPVGAFDLLIGIGCFLAGRSHWKSYKILKK